MGSRHVLRISATTIQQKIAALVTARQELKDEIEEFKTQYNTASTLLPALETQALNITSQLEYYHERLQELEQQLVNEARDNLERKAKIHAIVSNAGLLLGAFPYAKPILGPISQGLGVFANVIAAEKPYTRVTYRHNLCNRNVLLKFCIIINLYRPVGLNSREPLETRRVRELSD